MYASLSVRGCIHIIMLFMLGTSSVFPANIRSTDPNGVVAIVNAEKIFYREIKADQEVERLISKGLEYRSIE